MTSTRWPISGLVSCSSAPSWRLLSDGRRLDAWTVPQLLDSFFESQDPDAPKPEYVTFGLQVLDEGSYIELGDVVVVGGYPSDGKTALSMQMAWYMAKNTGSVSSPWKRPGESSGTV